MSSEARPEPPHVFVTVGTDHHRFDRLVEWIDRWLARQPAGEVRCLVQTGTSRTPHIADGRRFLTYPEMQTALSEAVAVVCHGGPGTIMMALAAGHKPIVVPRSSTRGEHVDDHQVAFARRVARSDTIWLTETEERLGALLDQAIGQPRLFRSDGRERTGTRAVEEIEVLVDRLFDRRESAHR